MERMISKNSTSLLGGYSFLSADLGGVYFFARWTTTSRQVSNVSKVRSKP